MHEHRRTQTLNYTQQRRVGGGSGDGLETKRGSGER